MRIISKPIVCAADNSASNRSINSHSALGGQYIVHKKNLKSFELGKVISDQRVSMLEIPYSVLRLQFIESR